MSNLVNNSVTLLYPKFYKKLEELLVKARAEGLDVYIFEGYRSAERQEHLYAQVPKVTNARGYMSWHQYGLAVDLVFGGPGKWSWKGPYEKLADLMIKGGLRWIGMKDPGHFEYDHPLSIFEAKQIVLKKGILSVWLNIENLMKSGEKKNGVS